MHRYHDAFLQSIFELVLLVMVVVAVIKVVVSVVVSVVTVVVSVVVVTVVADLVAAPDLPRKRIRYGQVFLSLFLINLQRLHVAMQ